MGQLIQMASISKKNKSSIKLRENNTSHGKPAVKIRHEKLDEIGAKILFFTGVRYERIGERTSISVK